MWTNLLMSYFYIGTSIYALIDLNKRRVIPNDAELSLYQFLVVIPLIGPVVYYFKILQKNRYAMSDYIEHIKCLKCGANNWSLTEKGSFLAAWSIFLTGISLFIVSGSYLFVNNVSVVLSIAGAIFLCYSRFVLRCKACRNFQEIKRINSVS